MRLDDTKMSADNMKQVRVDNWGIFFLQRLQMFFSKTDYCDMTLQFDGNVQLKVHRLVMNACTEYFQYLEQTCTIDENVIMMPPHLQADVIVPIVNFMYTGMLEFHLSTFEKLYRTAQTMNITILTKLLDAQKQTISVGNKLAKRKIVKPQVNTSGERKVKGQSDLPATLPGRKLPVWKRKTIPTSQTFSHNTSTSLYPDSKWSTQQDPLSLTDNQPKPTRFEWPEEELPSLSLMDTSFENISYTSKPLLTQEEEIRASTSFDDAKQSNNSSNRKQQSSASSSISNLDIEEIKSYVKEQKIRSGLSNDEEMIDNDLEEYNSNDSSSVSLKRKSDKQVNKTVITKKVRFDETAIDNKTKTISITTDKKTGELNHSQIVSEILKKYPHLVKKNKNIRLKIMAKNKVTSTATLTVDKLQRNKAQSPSESQKIEIRMNKPKETSSSSSSPSVKNKGVDNGPWVCDRCSTPDEPVEFVLYYLYRKHMTDFHNEKFDSKSCKYCGYISSKTNLLMYHLYTYHGMKPTSNYNFPKCNRCPFIALTQSILNKHQLRHTNNESQCTECQLAFSSSTALTSHIQITGHTGKSNKSNYDCQYCTKRFQSGNSLFFHVRLQHRNEAIRDGFVSIDETDDFEDDQEHEENSTSSSIHEEYILPEMIAEEQPTKKVNVLSNLKVSSAINSQHIEQDTQQHLSLEPSSEAEALNNVASGIATSLGLVDIVVLNDNQQLFLQSDNHHHHPQNYTTEQNQQHDEYILPEISSRETTFQVQNQHDQVITTDGVITQSMLSGGDIASTDELVMVLTDHDYGDNQEEINNDNSNIVVLYSHPVDGQQNQYITSEGNIMVNSQTGMIEIRNGATITSTANQVVMNPQDAHIESIEMIQREIESHNATEEPIQHIQEQKITNNENLLHSSSESVVESEQQQPHIEESNKKELPVSYHEENIEQPMEIMDSLVENIPVTSITDTTTTSTVTSLNADIDTTTTKDSNTEVIDEKDTVNAEEQQPEISKFDEKDESMEIDNVQESNEITHTENEQVPRELTLTSEEATLTKEEEQTIENTDENITEESTTHEESANIPPKEIVEEPKITTEEEKPDIIPENLEAKNEETVEEISSKTAEEISENIDKDMNEELETEKNELNAENALSPKEEINEISEEKHDEAIVSDEVEKENSDEMSNTQFEHQETQHLTDEVSQSSQESQEESGTDDAKQTSTTKISILDDWDDTDSQQSEQKEKSKLAEETVDKLMDDWEEEDEEDGKK